MSVVFFEVSNPVRLCIAGILQKILLQYWKLKLEKLWIATDPLILNSMMRSVAILSSTRGRLSRTSRQESESKRDTSCTDGRTPRDPIARTGFPCQYMHTMTLLLESISLVLDDSWCVTRAIAPITEIREDACVRCHIHSCQLCWCSRKWTNFGAVLHHCCVGFSCILPFLLLARTLAENTVRSARASFRHR